jgi:hypothetical protein
MTTPTAQARMTCIEQIRQFMLAGNATFTVLNTKSGNRLTFRVRRSKGDRDPVYFVSAKDGKDYAYMGTIWKQQKFASTRKSQIAESSMPFRGFAWLWRQVIDGQVLPANVEFWHEGQCGRCGKALTDPVSISLGIGPVCLERVGQSR